MIRLPAGHRLLHLDRTDSTNAEANRQARAGAEHGLVVLADGQDAGRGRQGRAWLTAEGSLAFSLLRRPDIAPHLASLWSLLAGVAVVDGLRARCPDLWLKWPNDVQIGHRKVGGILCEWDQGALVVGIGLNLAPPAGGWPPELEHRAAALPPDVGSRDEVLSAVLEHFDALERVTVRVGAGPLMDRYRRCLAPMIGERVTVDGGAEPWAGRVDGVEDSGALVVVDDAGARRAVLAGDVHLLPAQEP